eukprot:Rhum_TRINITY_DN14855_c2_g2::Rhum_TRINITY_DN14855_c2_g2_i2::g.122548::m.122548
MPSSSALPYSHTSFASALLCSATLLFRSHACSRPPRANEDTNPQRVQAIHFLSPSRNLVPLPHTSMALNMNLMHSPESKRYCASMVARIVLLMFATISLYICMLSDDSVASYRIANPGTVDIGVFKTTFTTLTITIDESLIAFLDDSVKTGWVCDGAKPLARGLEAFVVLSAISCAFSMLSAAPSRDVRLLNLSLVLGVAAGVFQTIAIALWVAFRHIKCTVMGTHQPRFPDGSDTYGIVLMSISLVVIIASVPLGVYSRAMHKAAYSYASIQ